jgi:small Trp-rich protein
MPLVLIGVLLLAAKMAEWGPMAEWSWWLILSPFAGAVLWWHFADTSGWTKQREMNKMEKKKIKRREKALDALGLNTARDKQLNAARAEAARRANAAEAAKRDQPQRPTAAASASSAPDRREPRL